MSRRTAELTTEEAAAFGRLLAHVGFAPTIQLGRGANAKTIRRITDENVVYALVEQPTPGLRDGTQRFALWIAPLHTNGNGHKGGRPASAWTAAARAAHGKRMKAMWAARRKATVTA